MICTPFNTILPCEDQDYEKNKEALDKFVTKTNIMDFVNRIMQEMKVKECYAYELSSYVDRSQSWISNEVFRVNDSFVIDFGFRINVFSHTKNLGGVILITDTTFNWGEAERHFDESITKFQVKKIGTSIVQKFPCKYDPFYNEHKITLSFKDNKLTYAGMEDATGYAIGIAHFLGGLYELKEI